MTLAVLVTNHLPEGVRGALSQWLVEVSPGTYVGTISKRVREEMWRQVASWVAESDQGNALLVHPSHCEQGYAMRSIGSTRYHVVDHEGIQLVSRQVRAAGPKAKGPAEAVDW